MRVEAPAGENQRLASTARIIVDPDEMNAFIRTVAEGQDCLVFGYRRRVTRVALWEDGAVVEVAELPLKVADDPRWYDDPSLPWDGLLVGMPKFVYSLDTPEHPGGDIETVTQKLWPAPPWWCEEVR